MLTDAGHPMLTPVPSHRCQKADWKSHKGACKLKAASNSLVVDGSGKEAVDHKGSGEEEGYPNEALLKVHGAEGAALAEPTKKELRKLLKSLPMMFSEGFENRSGRSDGRSTVVDKPTFLKHFHAFTGGVFKEWEPSMWENVLVAGGAVLSSLLTMPKNFAVLKTSPSHQYHGARVLLAPEPLASTEAQ